MEFIYIWFKTVCLVFFCRSISTEATSISLFLSFSCVINMLVIQIDKCSRRQAQILQEMRTSIKSKEKFADINSTQSIPCFWYQTIENSLNEKPFNNLVWNLSMKYTHLCVRKKKTNKIMLLWKIFLHMRSSEQQYSFVWLLCCVAKCARFSYYLCFICSIEFDLDVVLQERPWIFF